MNEAFDRVLSRYSERQKQERVLLDADPSLTIRMPNRWLLAVGEPVARMLHSLILGRGAKRILELGTSYGFSTLFLADAARRTGGKVISVDLYDYKQDHARRELTEAGLEQFVDFQLGDALEILEQLEGPFDFVLLDIWKQFYIPCFKLLRPKLADHAVIAADNMLKPKITRKLAEEYRAVIRADDAFQTMLLPVGQGVELSCLWQGQGPDHEVDDEAWS